LIEGRGVRGMTKEHLMLSLSYDIPFMIIITKIDLYDKETISLTLEKVTQLLKSAKKDVWLIREKIDLEIPKGTSKFIPIFQVSNVTGEGLDLLKDYLFNIPKRLDYSGVKDEPFEASVLESFLVEGIGSVAHCFVSRGTIRKGDIVWIGPDSIGGYHKSKVRSIQYKRIDVDFVLPGNHCTISVPGIDRSLLKQGVYVLHESVKTRLAIKEFTSDIKVLSSHPITIRVGYCPILNIDNIRMSAKLLKFVGENIETSIEGGKEVKYLRGGDRARVKFRFNHRPAYLKEGMTFVFREGKTRGYGKVVEIDS